MITSHADGITQSNGLRGNLTKDRAWRQRSAIKAEEKRRARQVANRNRARLTTSIGKTVTKRKVTPSKWPAKVRTMARRRSGGMCELDGCRSRGAQLHHRKLVGHGDHRICNALHVCVVHHDRIHRIGREAYVLGWLVKANRDPAVVPVVLTSTRTVHLTLDGDYQEAA